MVVVLPAERGREREREGERGREREREREGERGREGEREGEGGREREREGATGREGKEEGGRGIRHLTTSFEQEKCNLFNQDTRNRCPDSLDSPVPGLPRIRV